MNNSNVNRNNIDDLLTLKTTASTTIIKTTRINNRSKKVF